MRSLFPVFILNVILLLGVSSCKLQLKNPPAPPTHSLEGFWVDAETFGDGESNARAVLWIERYAGDEVPYRFTLVRLVHRDLMVSGKKVFVEERSGKLITSGKEVLFQQEMYRAVTRRNKDAKPAAVWPTAEYQPEILDREVRGGKRLALLEIAGNGLSMTDGDWEFKRALTPGDAPLKVHAAGVVLRASKDGRRAQIWSYTKGLRQAGAEFEFYRAGRKAGRLRIDGERKNWQKNWHESTAAVLGGTARVGDAVVAAGSLQGALRRTRLTREQILKKIQRGEKVSKEDLIRALKKKQ